MKEYPKVLLFGHSFNNTTGMGITLTNLFAEWPTKNIAIWSNHIDVSLCETIRPCERYIGVKHKKVDSIGVKKNRTVKTRLRELIRRLYYKTGIQELISDTTISLSEVTEAKNFNPDIIFCALGSSVAMRRCERVMNAIPKAKLVLYIVDDWVNTKINTRMFSAMWRRKYDKEFRRILNRSSGLLSICQYMSEEYKRIYNKNFYPFHNPVDLRKWNMLNPVPKYPNGTISIVYMGKINDDTYPCIINLSAVVKELNEKGNSYVLDIYSPDYSDKAYLFEKIAGTNIYPPIPHEEVATIFKSYTALFLPLGFSKQSRSYVRLSMPTKLSEYLASTKPILLNCPDEIALAKYLKDKNCAILCTDKSFDSLYRSALQLKDSNNYENLVNNSQQLAKVHDVGLVRERFRSTLNKFKV